MKLNYRLPPKLDNTIWYFGCSITWGEFCDLEQSAPYQLEKITGLPVDNLGICGGSPDLIHFQIKSLLKIYTPRAIVIQWPTDTRTFKLIGDELLNLGIWVTELKSWAHDRHPRLVTEYQKNVLNGTVQKNNAQSKIDVATLVNCPLITFTYKEYLGAEHIDLASDGRHPGPNSHRKIAEILSANTQLTGGS